MSMRPTLTLVAAMAHDNVIGIDNTLPWHLPEDLKHFKAVTLGKPVIMGRKTFDSIGRPLPGRLNIVITRQQDWQHEGVSVAHSLEAALALAGAAEEVCVIGGANLYEQALPLADKLCLTHIALEVAGDARFPRWQAEQWQCSEGEEQLAANGLRYRFADYLRLR
ncbi:dihydrofolate reductase [Vogesella sp. LIG4]|uniref:dihydrofolate reductase n=1 Tax=Vogesella sp. LIG4 TaxID=1192162 RepID=UPI00081FB777|nr:dihydrofolate reductase [Vogesella sp. LIG4]SCK06145.1 dihydrofolate reductase [Vogesella sp. LIG4]